MCIRLKIIVYTVSRGSDLIMISKVVATLYRALDCANRELFAFIAAMPTSKEFLLPVDPT